MDNDSNHLDLPPMNPLSTSQKTPEDYVFVHTDSHREFMDLLLDKRKRLEDTISLKEKERRNIQTALEDNLKESAKAKHNEEKENSQISSSEFLYDVYVVHCHNNNNIQTYLVIKSKNNKSLLAHHLLLNLLLKAILKKCNIRKDKLRATSNHSTILEIHNLATVLLVLGLWLLSLHL